MNEAGTDLPSLDLLRRMTDRHVLRQLRDGGALSRAEIAARTGLSKPTVSESVRRLTGSGLVREVGMQSGRRGRAGTNVALDADAACSLTLHAGPDGVVAERHDLRGRLLADTTQPVEAPITARRLELLLRDAVQQVVADAGTPVLATTISAADPVDQRTGTLVELPDSPFLIGELTPADVLSDLVEHAPMVDNDVNWAAIAEHRLGCATDLTDFAYCFLGAGMGLGLLSRGELMHGHHGLAGEIAHMPTRGPGGRALRLVQCFAHWGLLRPGTAAIDVPALLRVLDGRTASDRRRRADVIDALGLALTGVTTLLNPQALVLGGPWGAHPELLSGLRAALADAPVPAEVRAAQVGPDAPLMGARLTAVELAWTRLTAG